MRKLLRAALSVILASALSLSMFIPAATAIPGQNAWTKLWGGVVVYETMPDHVVAGFSVDEAGKGLHVMQRPIKPDETPETYIIAEYSGARWLRNRTFGLIERHAGNMNNPEYDDQVRQQIAQLVHDFTPSDKPRLGQGVMKRLAGATVFLDAFPGYKVVSIDIEEETHHVYILQRPRHKGEDIEHYDVPEYRGFSLFNKGRFVIVES